MNEKNNAWAKSVPYLAVPVMIMTSHAHASVGMAPGFLPCSQMAGMARATFCPAYACCVQNDGRGVEIATSLRSSQ